jgi:hypothetical protein
MRPSDEVFGELNARDRIQLTAAMAQFICLQ